MGVTVECPSRRVDGGRWGATERYLGEVCRSSEIIARVLDKQGSRTVWDLAAGASSAPVQAAYQAREDLWDAVVEYAGPLLGRSAARAAAVDLARAPVALTANHHGVDFFAQSVQGTLIFALARAEQGYGTVPVFAFGSVALNNLTYPRGLLLYAVNSPTGHAGPERLPLFPSKFNRTMVSSAGPVEPAMVDRATSRVRELSGLGAMSTTLGRVAAEILEQDYRSSVVLAQGTYATQAVLLNQRVWRRLFAGGVGPRLIHLEMEWLVGQLLQKDLCDPRSLASRVMFDRDVREVLVRALDGRRGCWEADKLRQLVDLEASGERDKCTRAGSGTLFLWGVDQRGRRVPLWLDAGKRPEALRGITDAGEYWEVPFLPSTICAGLRARRLLPSLFTCLLVTALARGVTCLGGYYQAEYLPAMQAAVASALEVSSAHDAAELVRQVPTSRYLSGMQTVMTSIGGIGLGPAGPVEIAAVGGLAASDRRRMLEVTVRDAHVASLCDTVPDTAPDAVERGWREALAREAAAQLSDKVVLV